MFATISITTICLIPFKAQAADASEGYLKIIADNTTAILDSTKVMLSSLEAYFRSWTDPDTSTNTPLLQSMFAEYTAKVVNNHTKQDDMQAQLSADLLGSGVTPQTLPTANDILYQTLQNKLYFSPDPRNPPGSPPKVNPAYNYLKNAAALNIRHTTPGFNWNGKKDDQLRYANYYNTIMAVQSYNGYLLSNDFVNGPNGNNLTPLQSALMTQASNSDWFKEVAGEPHIGWVLRQLLLYQSQMFVLMNQLIQTERQAVTAQAMTNSLIVLQNQTAEQMLLQRATGAPITQ